MVKGWPDFTVPISIEAVTIETLPIDIKTQTLPVLKIDISTQTLDALNINILGGLSDIRIGRIINPDFEEGETGWVFAEGAEIDTSWYKTGWKCVKILKDTFGNVDQAGISPPIDTNKIESFKISWMVDDIAVHGMIEVYYTDGTFDTTELVADVMHAWKTFDVNYDLNKFIAEVVMGCAAPPAGADMWYDSCFINMKIDEFVATSPTVNLNVDIRAQTVGNLNVNIAAIGPVTMDVNITGSVDINIKTSGGANIIIDKLTQTAYTERRSTLTNDGGTIIWDQPLSQNRQGKFFPRGARGFIDSITAYCYDSGASGGTLTILISPHPNMGAIWTGEITIPAAGAAAWRSVNVRRMWNYDSLFVMFYLSQNQLSLACDANTPYDCFGSADYGATWQGRSYRFFVRVDMHGETVGDIPFSGTVNTIEIPSVVAGADSTLLGIPATTEVSMVTINGTGKILRVQLETTHDQLRVRFFMDGTQIPETGILAGFYFTGLALHTIPVTSDTPQIQLFLWTDAGLCRFASLIPFEFKRSFEVRIYNPTGSNYSARVGVTYTLLA